MMRKITASMTSLKKVLYLLSAVVAISQQTGAQTATGTIGGTILDPQGSVIVGARIEIRNEATGAHRESLSNAEGLFLAAALMPGSYELTVDAAGFRPETRKQIL